jgi:hypothetical protein
MTLKTVGIALAGTATVLGGGTVATDQIINPYTTVGSALEIMASSTVPEAGTVATLADTTQPKITLSKWGGQVAMGVTYTGIPTTTTGGRPFLSKNVEWSSGTQKMEAVPIDATTTMEDGGMEININLSAPPASNQFDFAISGAANLDFFYQAPLWQEAGLKAPTADCSDTVCKTDGEGTSTRPDNVAGSYAVYYKNHKDHIEGQTNFATGKAYQIFRPLVTDAKGNTAWADLSYATGTLSVTVPQVFLDSAIYPVKVDPTFGYTTVGASQTNLANDTALVTLTANSPAGAKLSSLSAYSSMTSGTCATENIIYSNASPLALVDYTAQYLLGTTAQWNTLSVITGTTLGGVTSYYIGAENNAQACVGNWKFNYDTGGTSNTNGTYLNPPGATMAVSAEGTGKTYSAYVSSIQDINKSLVGWWTLDSNRAVAGANGITDSSGNGNHGTEQGALSPITGIMAQTLSLDGTDQCVIANDTASLRVEGGNATWSIWLYPTNAAQSTDFLNPFWDKENGSGGSGGIYAFMANSKVGFYIGAASYFSTTFSNNKWYHVALVKTGTTLNLYVNDVKDTTSITWNGSGQAGVNLAIGCDSTTAGRWWAGYIDDARIYNRALSAGEVAALYYQGISQHDNGPF